MYARGFWQFFLDPFDEAQQQRVVLRLGSLIPNPAMLDTTGTSAGMSTVYQFAAAQVVRALAEAHPNCGLGSGSIPLPNSHEGS